MQFVIHQVMHRIFLGKSGRQLVAMLPDSLHQIAGHADVERAVALTGKDVGGGLHGSDE